MRRRILQWTGDLCWALQQRLARVAAEGDTVLLALAAIPGPLGEEWAVTSQENVAHPSPAARRVLSPLILVTIIYILCLFQA